MNQHPTSPSLPPTSPSPNFPQPPHPDRSHSGLTGVLIFLGVAVMISLVWTQIRESERRSKPLLPILGETPDISFLVPTNSTPAGETRPGNGHLWLVHFVSATPTQSSLQTTTILAKVSEVLDSVGDRTLRIASICTTSPPPASPSKPPTSPTTSRFIRFQIRPNAETYLNSVRHTFENLIPSQDATTKAPHHNQLESRIYILDGQGRIRSCRNAFHPNVVADLLLDLGALTREQTLASKSPAPN